MTPGVRLKGEDLVRVALVKGLGFAVLVVHHANGRSGIGEARGARFQDATRGVGVGFEVIKIHPSAGRVVAVDPL